jgi:Tfp pilus assembly protein PilN
MKAVNLIPTDQRRATPSGNASGGAYAVLGVLAVLLALAVVYVMTSNSVNDRESKAAQARQEADAAKAQVEQLGAFTDFASIKEQRLASVMAAAEIRFDWERFMRELSRVMPQDSWVHTTNASVVGDTTGGTTAPATSTSTSTALAGPEANLVGCTPRQAEVARMMVRLEQMYRVTEVSLNESSQESAGGVTSLQSCGDLYKFDLTVTFSPVEPDDEAPKGETRVPAALGGGS